MDGVSAATEMASAMTALGSSETAGEVQVRALKSAMDNEEASMMSLLQGLGRNLDVSA